MRLLFAILAIVSSGFIVAAAFSPAAAEYRADVPVSLGDPDAPVHVIAYGDMMLPTGVEADVEQGTTRVTFVVDGAAQTDCTNRNDCRAAADMPNRYNPAGIEPLLRLGYEPLTSQRYTELEQAQQAYEELKVRIGR